MAANLNRFYADTLKAIGAPDTPANRKFLSSWQAKEGGWTNNSASFNPLNTTHGPGQSINSVGVKAFSDYGTGVKMTAQTILNGRYPNIVAGLRSGNPYNHDVSGDLSTWVSGSPTGGLSYAASVTGQKSTGAPRPNQVRSVQSSRGQKIGPGTNVNKQKALQWLSIAQEYAQTGEVQSNSVARVVKAVDRLGTVEPPHYNQAKSQARSPMAGGVVDSVLAAAHDQVGKPYVFGSGPDTSSFDCSDLIQWAYKQVGIDIPRTTFDQINVGQAVNPKNLKPGDLVFPSNHHVVMYVGGGKVIAAPHTGTVVQYQPLSRFGNIVAARRIVQ